ncbi:MAG TPA: phosphotransferase [Candidatus Magasanikbacteria bacterium]|nr:phosphotransferase [Candidatus Magasanikbacteria bacterium]
MWRQLLYDVLGKEAESYQIIEVARSGASGPKVLFLKNFITEEIYAFKYGLPEQLRVPITKQIANRRTIAPLFGEHHLPEIVLSGENFIMMPAIKGHDLHMCAMEGIYDLEYLLEMESRILDHFSRVWQKTALPYVDQKFTRDPLDRAARIRKALQSRVFGLLSVEDIYQKTVVINGQEQPPLGVLLDKMTQLYSPPKNIVICHGDPNADNILINDRQDWWLIDWEWVGIHDWRILASHLIGWWLSNASLLISHPKIEVNNKIKISYQIGFHPLIGPMIDQAWRLAENLGQTWQEENWRQQINLQLANLLLGDIRFLEARGRPRHTVPLLGEGLKYLAEL